jgi:hypothetical protein
MSQSLRPITVEAFEIRDLSGLDPVRVILQDAGPGQGRLIVECYGQAWSCFWAAMGSNLRSFLRGTDPDYVATALGRGCRMNKREEAYLLRIAAAVLSSLRESPAAQPR